MLKKMRQRKIRKILIVFLFLLLVLNGCRGMVQDRAELATKTAIQTTKTEIAKTLNDIKKEAEKRSKNSSFPMEYIWQAIAGVMAILSGGLLVKNKKARRAAVSINKQVTNDS